MAYYIVTAIAILIFIAIFYGCIYNIIKSCECPNKPKKKNIELKNNQITFEPNT